MKRIEIKTERLLLRPLSPDDLETTHAYASDRENTRYMTYLPNDSIEQTRRFLQSVTAAWDDENDPVYEFAVTLEGRHIGAVSVYIDDGGTGELGWIIDRACHGKGYATEAARALIDFSRDILHLKKLCAHCDADNLPSERVMQKSGMTLEASDCVRQNKQSDKPSRGLKYSIDI